MATSPNKKFVTGGTGLMGLATKAPKTTAAKKDEKETINAEPTVAKAIDDYVKAKTDIDNATAIAATAAEIIKNAGKDIFLADMKKTTKAKDSFILASPTNGTLYIVQDAYKRANLDEDRVNYLRETYGEDIVKTDNLFVFNPEMVEKYGDILCELITKSTKIPAADKGLIISLQQSNTIAKGTINKLSEIAKTSKTSVEQIFEEIQPTQQLKVRGAK